MKKFSFILLLTAMIFSVSCNEIENPFKGTDNNVISFSLKQGEATFDAAIAKNEIILSVPVGIDLTGASATVEICEQATIIPDPASIKDWNNEQTFQVTSYTEETKTYTYKINRTDINSEGNVTLLTQADVDKFAESGVTVINGSLVIGAASATLAEKDTIKSLEALKTIKEVKYNLYINNTFGGNTLKGLDNIESLGALYIGSHTATVKTFHNISAELSSLKNAGSIVINCETVEALSFPALEATSGLRISSKNINKIEAANLKEIAGDLLLTNASNAANTVLKNISFPKLTTITGELNFQYFSKLESLSLPELNTVGANITFQFNSAELKEIAMPKLETVAGGIAFEKFVQLESISFPKVKKLAYLYFNNNSWDNCNPSAIDFSALEEVTGNIMVKNLIKLESVSFPKLRKVGDTFTIRGSKLISTLSIPALTEAKKMVLWDLGLVKTIDLSKITKCDKYEFISTAEGCKIILAETINDITLNLGSKEYCPTLSGVKTVNGKIEYTNSNYNKEIIINGIETIKYLRVASIAQEGKISLPAVKNIQYFEVSANRIKTIDAPILSKVDTLDLSYTWKLTEVNMPELKTVKLFKLDEQGGNSSYYEQYAIMTNLDNFASISSIEEVEIINASKLFDFTAFGELSKNIKDGKWKVENCKYNPTLEDMKAGKYTPEK